ncbi:MAG TPA: hypothetical protein VFR23_24780 [Jiangellaceae bacterium]|nr:hypothetical protein [Jiangellaceae bacterium]
MLIESGDLWDAFTNGWHIVVTTNIGWDANGVNNMGAGVALQAAIRFPDLPGWYGRRCRRTGASTGVIVHPERRLILFPVKPLKLRCSADSWNQQADLGLIELSCGQLADVLSGDSGMRVAMAFPGCGNGGLSKRAVRPILEKSLGGFGARLRVIDWAQ